MSIRILFIFLCIYINAHSQSVYKVESKYPVHDVMPNLKIIEDFDNILSARVILQDTTLKFFKRKHFARNLRPNTTYWGKLHLRLEDDLTEWTLNFEDKNIGPPAWTKSNGKVDVFGFMDNTQIFHKKTGVGYPKRERDTKDNWVLNKVILSELQPYKNVTLVIKVSGNQLGYPPYFNLSLRSPKQAFYHQIFQFHNSFNIFMFGVTFIIFIYHFLQFVYLKEKVFLWFSAWLLFCTLTQAMTIGFIIGSTTIFRFGLWSLVANGIFYMFWFFGRSFIDSKNKYPLLDKWILGLSSFLIIETIILTIYVYGFDVEPVLQSVGIHNYVIGVYTLCSLIISIILVTKKDVFSKYFGFGSIIASIFLIIGNLWSMGVIKFSQTSIDPYVTGMFFQIIIYSFGIAYRQQQLDISNQKEKLRAQETYAEMQRIRDLDEIKSRFFANISHEFRTPLTLISGPINRANINKEDLNTITIDKKYFEIIKNNTNRLQSLVDQLLDLSKIESGKVHLSLKKGGIIKFLRSIVFSFESMAERQNISLNTSFPVEIDYAIYDKDKLQKIVTNVLSNAFKYTPENGTISINIEGRDNHHLHISISDTGKGISNEELDRIFERFYRVEGSEEKGSGIGLALTKELIELHNGQISVDSTREQGTTFKIRIPITMNFLPEDISIMDKSTKLDSPIEYEISGTSSFDYNNSNRSRNMPIALIVEDNKDLQFYIGEVLKKDYSLLFAKDGLQGERMAIEHIPDIIISDVMMPRKDGYELCNNLKTNTKTSHIPIILLTAKAGETNKIEGLTQGADAYLTKPFNDKELILLTKNLVSSKKNLWNHFKALNMLLVDDIEVSSIDDKFLQNVFKIIKDNIDNESFGVEDIAKGVGFSRSQLHRKLKALSDKSANQLITEIRLNEAHRLLTLKKGTVSEIAYTVGYSNLSYFTKSFKEKFGILPSKI